MNIEYGFFIGSMLIFGYSFKFYNFNDVYNLYEKSIKLGVNVYYINKNKKEVETIQSEVLLKVDNYLKDVLFKVNWKIIEVITLVNEYYRKNLKPKFHELTNNYFRVPIKVIKNGEEILNFRNNNDLSKYFDSVESINYDFILYTKYHRTESKKNLTIVSDKIIENYEDNMVESEVGFIIFQLINKNNNKEHKYDINLKEPKNYLVKDNILYCNFFKYYMKSIYNIDLEDEFSISYMTNDMNQSKLNSPFYIKLNDVGLTSFPMKKEKKEKKEENRREENKDYKENLISKIINQEKLKHV